MPAAIDLTRVKASVYDLKRGLDGITGDLALVHATREGYEAVEDGTITSGWHPKQRTKFGETILEMRIAELVPETGVAILAASHLRYTLRDQVLVYKFSAGERPRKGTLVWKLQLRPTGEKHE